MRILLVEDDDSIREVFKLMLEAENPLPNLVVDTASSGHVAVDQVKQARPDLVLLDLTLTGEHGFDVFHRLRKLENCSNLPIVAVTAHNLKDLEREALGMGFVGYVTKPIDFDSTLFPLIKRIAANQLDPGSHAA